MSNETGPITNEDKIRYYGLPEGNSLFTGLREILTGVLRRDPKEKGKGEPATPPSYFGLPNGF